MEFTFKQFTQRKEFDHIFKYINQMKINKETYI